MTTYKPRELATIAKGAGFRGDALVRAVAVALAESGGNPSAVGVNTDRYRSRDRGLWQINDHWHPDVSDAEAFNPQQNAAAAYRISSGGKDWSPWSTWKNGAAAAQMNRARVGVAQAAKNPAGATPAKWDPLDPLGPYGYGPGNLLGDLFNGGDDVEITDVPRAAVAGAQSARQLVVMAAHAGAWMSDPHNWGRVVMVTAGAAAVIVGLQMVAKSGAAGSTAAAAAAIPAKATKAAVTAGATVATGGAAAAAKGAGAVKAAAKTVKK